MKQFFFWAGPPPPPYPLKNIFFGCISDIIRKYQNCLNFSLDKELKVIHDSLEAYGHVTSSEIKKLKFAQNLGT